MSDPITGDAQLDAFIREEEARRYPQLVAPSQERGQEQEPDPDEPLPQLRSPEQDRPRGLMETALRRGLRRWPRDWLIRPSARGEGTITATMRATFARADRPH